MANKVNIEERIPWNGKNHEEFGYNEPILTNTMTTISPKLEILTTGKDKAGITISQNEDIRSDKLFEGIKIPVKSNEEMEKE